MELLALELLEPLWWFYAILNCMSMERLRSGVEGNRVACAERERERKREREKNHRFWFSFLGFTLPGPQTLRTELHCIKGAHYGDVRRHKHLAQKSTNTPAAFEFRVSLHHRIHRIQSPELYSARRTVFGALQSASIEERCTTILHTEFWPEFCTHRQTACCRARTSSYS